MHKTDLFATVLIIESDQAILQILKSILSSLHIKLSIASSPDEAIHRLRREDVDTIVVQNTIRSDFGIQVLSSMRDIGLDIPAVIIVNNLECHTILRAMTLGAVDFIEKPFVEKEVLDAVHGAIELGICSRNIEKTDRTSKIDSILENPGASRRSPRFSIEAMRRAMQIGLKR